MPYDKMRRHRHLIETEAMKAEWFMWLKTGDEMKTLGFEDGWNDPKLVSLHVHIVAWAETLVTLRMHQTEEVQLAALNEAIERLP